MTQPITAILTPHARAGGLRTILNPLPPNWERGIDVFQNSVSVPERIGPCDMSPGEPDPKGNLIRFKPVIIRQGVICSTMGLGARRGTTSEFSRQVTNVTMDYVLSLELQDGAATNNPSLADAEMIGTATDLKAAISLLEDSANQSLSGRLAVIHVPLGLSAYLSKCSVSRQPDGTLQTMAGNLVVVHGSGTTIYVTGELWGSSQIYESREHFEWLENSVEGWTDAVGLIAFDPGYIKSVVVEPATSPGTSE